jgi:hypothetical protein
MTNDQKLSLTELPNELIIAIFSFFNSSDMTKFFFSLKPFTEHLKYIIHKYDLTEEVKHLKIKIPGWYIIKSQKRNKEVKQLVKIDNSVIVKKKNNKKWLLYEYHYGMWSYHEGFCNVNNILELTHEEQNLLKNNDYLKLPQELYHSELI